MSGSASFPLTSDPTSSPAPLSASQALTAGWGVLGVVALLAQATWRLGERAWEAHSMTLTPLQIGVSLAWVALNAYAEGYRAFQLRFSPRVVVRAHHLARHPHPVHVALAPLYCMGLIHATRRAQIIAWATVVMIVGFVLTLRLVPQPWRGIVDGGVVVALCWGMAAIAVLFVRSLTTGRLPAVSAEVPPPQR